MASWNFPTIVLEPLPLSVDPIMTFPEACPAEEPITFIDKVYIQEPGIPLYSNLIDAGDDQAS